MTERTPDGAATAIDYAAMALSSYFRHSHQALEATRPEDLDRLQALVAAPVTPVVVASLHRQFRDQTADCALRLRRLRRLLMMAMMERDARQQAPVEEIVAATSALAEIAIADALQVAAAEAAAVGRAPLDSHDRPMDLLVVGMGKLGGGELNVSSDIDLVFVMRDQGPTPERAQKIARRMINLLSETTADGFVFRVDTRLRPHGDSGPLICSLAMLEQYFFEQGREWERFAWLKARVVADSGLAAREQRVRDERALMQVVTPFVYRRYLDYAALAALAGLHDLINQEASRNQGRRLARDRHGFDVKLGRGGIREIEFSAQLHQVMRGGRDASLRERSTPAALRRIADRGVADAATTAASIEAWTLLRRTEHALQYLDDEQTHWLPGDHDRRELVARFLGLELEAFDQRLRAARRHVEQVFDRLLAPARGAHDDEETAADVAAAGAMPPTAAAIAEAASAADAETTQRLTALRESRRYRLASEETRQRIERLVQRALRWGALDGRPPPAAWIGRLCDLLETVAGRPAYLRVLTEHRPAYEQLLLVLSQARWAATYLNQHPVVLDELLDGQILEPLDIERWDRHLRQQLAATRNEAVVDAAGAHPPDFERQMDVIREEHHAAVFRLLAQDLSGKLTVEAVGDELSALADTVLAITIDLAWQQVPRRHRERPSFAIIAYGKLGGLELGYASDLDLVFLFDDDHEDALQNYSQLGQKIGQWLSMRTAAGQLFEIDLRLRPNGNAGLLVSSIRSFDEYQHQSAWVWEHQALTRARYAAGDRRIGSRFEVLRREVLARPRNHETLADEIVSMRQKMHDGHPNRSELFDLKHDAGGMVDIEFIVQYLVLAYGALFEDLLDNRGNIELLRRAASAGLIDHDDARVVADAYRTYRRLQHALRLNDESYARVEPGTVVTEAARVRSLWRSLFGDVEPTPDG
jgi:glutamate-ammonia-ligase adenylyltransferase